MKYKIIFSALLAVIIAIGITGVDIAEKIFSSKYTEETVISRDSITSNAIYIDSPDEISFDPMKIINEQNAYDNTEITENIYWGKNVCTALVTALSKQSSKTAYESPLAQNLDESVNFDGKYYYAKQYKYINPDNELRYLDFIITAYDYTLIYINFYSNEEYNLNADDISEGLEKFRSYSESFYNMSLDDLEKKYSELFDSLPSPFDYNYEISFLPIVYDDIFAYFDQYFSYNYNVNPVEYFWIRTFLPTRISFIEQSVYYDEDIDSYQTEEYTNITFSTGYFFDALNNLRYNEGVSYITDKTDYVIYNGRIYQTIEIKDSYINSIIMIYNINYNIIEGIYAETNYY